MSSDAIVAGLKQGNAIELGVLQNMKEGLNTVVDGMINECLNRSDGLSELMEKLKLDRSTASYTTTPLTSDQKALLKNSIERGIRDCDTAYQDDLSKFVDKLKEISADSLEEVKAWKEAAELEELHAMDTKLRMDLIIGLPYNWHISAFVMAEGHKENVRKARYDALLAAEDARIVEKAKKRASDALNTSYSLINVLVNQLRSLWTVAEIGDIDLDSTTDFRIPKFRWLGGLVEVYRTHLGESRPSIKGNLLPRA